MARDLSTWQAGLLERHSELSRYPLAGLGRHALLFRKGRSLVGAFTGRPLHYLDSRRRWVPIERGLRPGADGYLGAPGLPFEVYPDGTSRDTGRTFAYRSLAMGTLVGETFTAVGVFKDGTLDADRLVRNCGGMKGLREEVTIREGLLRHEIILAEPLAGLTEGALFVVQGRLQGARLPQGDFTDARLGAWGWRPAAAHDAAGRRTIARQIAWGELVYVGVPAAWLAGASYPVTIDPDFAGDTADGAIYGSSSNQTTAINTSTGYGDAGSVVGVVVNNAGGIYTIQRGYFKFDTSAIGIGATILQVKLQLTVNNNPSSGTNAALNIKEYDWGFNDPMASGTRESAFDGAKAASIIAQFTGSTGWSSGEVHTSPNLSTGWVDPVEISYYCMQYHNEGVSIGAGNARGMNFRSADYATPGDRPVLVVDFQPGNPTPDLVAGTFTLPDPGIGLFDTRVKLRARRRQTWLGTAARAKGNANKNG